MKSKVDTELTSTGQAMRVALWNKRRFLIWALALLTAVPSSAQQPQGRTGLGSNSTIFSFQAPEGNTEEAEPIPAPFEENGATAFDIQITALGARLRVPGKERTVIDGRLTDGGGVRSAQVVLDLSSAAELRGFKSTGETLKFDGKTKPAGLSTIDVAFLEAFCGDTAEALFSAERKGVAIRFLGANFKPGEDMIGNGVSPVQGFDIYQAVVAPVTQSSTKLTKRFFFDSKTALLEHTQYREAGLLIETRFGDWTTIDGSIYPGRIERYEGGRRVFLFNAESVYGGPAIDVAPLFR